jgi:hypothetical protein
MHISISEMQNYLRCKRLWDYSSVSRKSLRSKTTGTTFFTGSAVHAGIEANIKGEDYRKGLTDYVNSVEHEVAEEDLDFASDLLTQYFDHYGTENPLDDQDLTYLGAEVSFKIPLDIMDPEGEPVNFVGTWDAVAEDSRGGIWLVENKTAAKRADIEHLQYNNQVIGYSWAFQVLTGIPVKGVLYNGIIKRLIQPTKILKSGKLSQDKNASTTVEEFAKALSQTGSDPVQYMDYLQYLEAQGVERFFMREKLYPVQNQLENFGHRLDTVCREMVDSPRIYPTIPWNGCTDCRFRDLCHSEERGMAVDVLIQTKYEVGSYGTMQAVDRITPDMVQSKEDLIEVLRSNNER